MTATVLRGLIGIQCVKRKLRNWPNRVFCLERQKRIDKPTGKLKRYFKTDIDGSVVFIDSVASCYMNVSLGRWGGGGCRVLSKGAGGEGSSSGSAVAGSVCSPGCCESLRVGQHVISSPSTGQVGSHFGHILFHNVSSPIIVSFLRLFVWFSLSGPLASQKILVLP